MSCRCKMSKRVEFVLWPVVMPKYASVGSAIPPVELLMRSGICGPIHANGLTAPVAPEMNVVEAAKGMSVTTRSLKSTAVFSTPVAVMKVFGPRKPKGSNAASKVPLDKSELGVT